jgi:hypothetical protein
VTDVETAPGGQTLVARMPPDQRGRRFGVRFPRLARCDAADWPTQVAQGVRWLCRELLPALVYRVMPAGTAGADDHQWGDNGRLFRFMAEFSTREARLTRILHRGMSLADVGHVKLQGLYLAATGADKQFNQAFLAGVMPQVLEMQNGVAWTTEALRRDAACRFYTRIGYATLAAVLLALAAIAWRASL